MFREKIKGWEKIDHLFLKKLFSLWSQWLSEV